jgi:hypothetical protein
MLIWFHNFAGHVGDTRELMSFFSESADTQIRQRLAEDRGESIRQIQSGITGAREVVAIQPNTSMQLACPEEPCRLQKGHQRW